MALLSTQQYKLIRWEGAILMSDTKVFLSLMRWNWQRPDWPNFTWNTAVLAQAEQQFLVVARYPHRRSQESYLVTADFMKKPGPEMIDKENLEWTDAMFANSRRV